MTDAWRTIVAAALDAREAHVTFDRAVADLAPALRGRRPDGLPHSAWELVEHVRLTQADLIAYLEDPAYAAPAWPAGSKALGDAAEPRSWAWRAPTTNPFRRA